MKVRQKRCKECKELFTPIYSTTQIACSPKCAYAFSKRRDKQIKEQNSVSLTILKQELKENLPKLKKQTQLLVNKYVRLRDKGLDCISQCTSYKSDFDAGHCFPLGSYEGLRYDLDNIHGQSIGANRFKEGDHINYLLNLPNRIGQQRTDALIIKAKDYKKNGYKFSKDELIKIQSKIKQLIKELK